MCTAPKQKETPAPAAPAETLEQAAPAVPKKTSDVPSKGATADDPLTIGTKKYRNPTNKGTSGISTIRAPSGVSLN